MRILITGAAGMIGAKLVARLLADGQLGGKAIAELILHDLVAPLPLPSVIPVVCLAGDLAARGASEALVAHRPDVIFHLAGVVSGEAEANFELGYSVNLDGTRALFEAIRSAGYGRGWSMPRPLRFLAGRFRRSSPMILRRRRNPLMARKS